MGKCVAPEIRFRADRQTDYRENEHNLITKQMKVIPSSVDKETNGVQIDKYTYKNYIN